MLIYVGLHFFFCVGRLFCKWMVVGCLVIKLKGVNPRCRRAQRGVKFVAMRTLTEVGGTPPFVSKHCKFAADFSIGKHRLVLLGPSAFVGLDNFTIHC